MRFTVGVLIGCCLPFAIATAVNYWRRWRPPPHEFINITSRERRQMLFGRED